jgi:hypothetical protein
LQQADQMVEQLQQQLAESEAGHQAALDKARWTPPAARKSPASMRRASADVEEMQGPGRPAAAAHAAAARPGRGRRRQTEESRPAASQAAEPAQTLAQPE